MSNKNKHKKYTINESKLRTIVHNMLLREFSDDFETKDDEIWSDWNDIDSWNSEYPTDGAWDFRHQEGSDTYGKMPGVHYDSDDVDKALESPESNQNIYNSDNGMEAMDRFFPDKETRDKYPSTVYGSGRSARGEEYPYSPDSTNTFDDEIEKYSLNMKESILSKMISESIYNTLNEAREETILTNRLINKLHKVTHQFSHLYHDDGWQNVKMVLNAIDEVDGVTDVIASAGVYHNYLNNATDPHSSPYRTYALEIETIYGTLIGGELTCSAAGTVEDPFDRYDITCQFWRK